LQCGTEKDKKIENSQGYLLACIVIEFYDYPVNSALFIKVTEIKYHTKEAKFNQKIPVIK